MKGRPNGWMIAAACAVALVACTPRKAVKKSTSATGTDAATEASATSEALPPGVEVGEASIKDGGSFAETKDLQSVPFDYDAYMLGDEARGILRKNADHLKKHPDLEILVAGHCDERGTTEYNLALGQKRAKEVREYYIRLGLPGKTIATISYGEEKPSCDQATEACWRENRRAETRIRSRTASSQEGLNPKAPQ